MRREASSSWKLTTVTSKQTGNKEQLPVPHSSLCVVRLWVCDTCNFLFLHRSPASILWQQPNSSRLQNIFCEQLLLKFSWPDQRLYARWVPLLVRMRKWPLRLLSSTARQEVGVSQMTVGSDEALTSGGLSVETGDPPIDNDTMFVHRHSPL